MTYEEIISKIQACSITDSDEFDLYIDDIAVAVEDLSLSTLQREVLIEQLLLNIENQPEPEFTSWSLVHFLEWLDQDNSTNYNALLLKSLKIRPKVMTLLLTNRVLNDLPDTSTDRILFLAALKEITSDSTIDEIVKNEANEFYEYQLNKEQRNKTAANIILAKDRSQNYFSTE
jgi:phytoene/squalene synthetase